MKLNLLTDLPTDPTKVHPITGEPIRALWRRPDGRLMWPIMGGAPDDPPKNDPPADPPKNDPPKTDPPKADPPKSDPDDGKDLGFPKDTPRSQMTDAEKLAYDAHHGRKHEQRASEYRDAAGGKSAAEVKAAFDELEKLRRERLSDHEKAVEDAKAAAKEEAAREHAPKAARAVFELALQHVEDKDERAEILAAIDVTSVINENGDIDTDKVSRIVARLAPAGKDGDRRIRDFGGGERKTAKTTGVATGRSLFEERHGKKSTNDS